MKTFGPTLLLTLTGAIAFPASAQEIGRADAITTRVSAEIPGRVRTLAVGATLIQDEWIRTNGTGRADISFIDGTQLAVGPGSSVKLDEYVYSPGRGGARFVLNAAKGLFRFTTGNLPKGAYQIRTPVGVLGVRGTQFTFRVEPTRVVVSVTQGSVSSCAGAGGASRCAEAGPGQSLISTPREVTRRATSSLPRNLTPPRLPAAQGVLQRAGGAGGRGLDLAPNTGLPLPRAGSGAGNTPGLGIGQGIGQGTGAPPGLSRPSSPGGASPGFGSAPGLGGQPGNSGAAPGLGGGGGLLGR
ncbi:MAG: FecR domain-containing protein [Beijerinckiaceae bacterium]|nr:FecR domain-containing protein [Beijerinckiaceae bacterium]